MHELSIALSILELAEEAAERHKGTVTEIHMRLGPLSGVVKESLHSAYDLACEASATATAKLVLEEVPVVVYCPACAAERTLTSAVPLCCPICGVPTPNVLHGRELEVVA